MKIGSNIKRIRRSQDLTQREVADRLGISQTAYRKFESDATSPRLDTMVKLAAALGVTVHDLIPKEAGLQDDQLQELEEYFKTLNESGKEKALDFVGILGRVADLRK